MPFTVTVSWPPQLSWMGALKGLGVRSLRGSSAYRAGGLGIQVPAPLLGLGLIWAGLQRGLWVGRWLLGTSTDLLGLGTSDGS